MKLDIPKAILLLAAIAVGIWAVRSAQIASVDNPDPGLLRDRMGADGMPAILAAHSRSTGMTSALELVQQSTEGLRNLPGISANLELSIDFAGEKIESRGTYLQAGTGTPLSRWDFDFGTDQTPMILTSIFDGHFYYHFTAFGETRELYYVDLSSVPSMQHASVDSLAPPSGWFGTGSLAAALDQISGSFDLAIADATKTSGSMKLTTVRGEWKRDALRQLLREQIDPAWLEGEIPWSRFPAQLPHSVEITFGTDENLMLFPYRIVFQQYRNGSPSPTDFIVMQLKQVGIEESVDQQNFVFRSDDVYPVDKTDDYLARIKMYLRHPVGK